MNVVDRIKAEIEPLYLEIFGRKGFDALSVELGEDHAGEQSVFVRARVNATAMLTKVKGMELFGEKVRAKVRDIIPDRFCYLQYTNPPERKHAAKPGVRHKRLAS